jgi:hypothetical protein
MSVFEAAVKCFANCGFANCMQEFEVKSGVLSWGIVISQPLFDIYAVNIPVFADLRSE